MPSDAHERDMSLTWQAEHEAQARLERGLAGRYVIERELGRGATARVFLAT